MMAVMYTFCRYFSVRLGTILVAVSSMIQSFILGAIFLVLLNNAGQMTEDFEDWRTDNKLIYTTELFEHIQYNIAGYLKSVIVFIMFHFCTCVLLIYAALKCNVPLTWPFLVVEFVRLATFAFVHFTAMMLVKENILDLGLLIALSISGGFLLLGLYYSWFCVVSLCQCLRELRAEQKPGSAQVNLLVNEFRHLAKATALSRQQFPPVTPSWRLPAAHDNYGNLAWPTY
ncbi:uncharacterized protein LOC124368030 [Homalodisca vitripennis]|uniref:uncharacterized protein LOC124368030 n=1 Tax=Homalodisca vitripennis TaxID=197043 RepID=UPI001EEC66FB|nr:uncharacterized protein LOC124368030 [Homalodisca vitripennis]